MADATLDTLLGPTVETHLAQLPGTDVIHGIQVTLIPLHVSHTDDLYSSFGANEDIWTYTPQASFESIDPFRKYLHDLMTRPDVAMYTIMCNKTSCALGLFGLSYTNTKNRSTEIGYIRFGPALQRTKAATEAVYLLSRYAFEDLGMRRYTWRCHSLNEASMRAATRYGFVFEGVFRQEMISQGRNRDTAFFSMLDREWLNAKTGFEAWLNDANFDKEGRQKKSLADIRNSVG